MDGSEVTRDYEAKNSKRPQSIMALSLAAQIDSAFSLDGSSDIDSLARSVSSKKQTVDQQAQELHVLEARLRETEERLRQQQQQQSQYQEQRQSLNSVQTGNSHPRYPSNSASTSQTFSQHTSTHPRSPVQGQTGSSTSSRAPSNTPSMQQMNQAYQYGTASQTQRYAGGAAGYGQQQAYPYRTASGR